MYNRREFIGAVGKPAAAVLAVAVIDPLKMTHALEALANHKGTPDDIAMDESFWFEVQKGFTVDRSIINLNNGGVSPSSTIVQEAMKRHLDYSNTVPVYSMWQILEP